MDFRKRIDSEFASIDFSLVAKAKSPRNRVILYFNNFQSERGLYVSFEKVKLTRKAVTLALEMDEVATFNKNKYIICVYFADENIYDIRAFD